MKKLTNNLKCKVCCTSLQKCNCGVCLNTNKKCKCETRTLTTDFKRCKMITKRKNVFQQQCCVHHKVCRNKSCKILKKKKECKYEGLEIFLNIERKNVTLERSKNIQKENNVVLG